MQIMHFILDKILKLLTYYTPFYHQSLHSYLISKNSFFGPPCTCNNQRLTIRHCVCCL